MNAGNHNLPQNASAGDAEFEQVLRSAMQARPEPFAPTDLAARAMTIAQKLEFAPVLPGIGGDLSRHPGDIQRRLIRQRRWTQITGIAATLLITAMLVGAAYRMWNRGDIAAIASATTSDSSSTTDSVSSSTDSSSSTTNLIVVVFFAEFLVLGIILMSMSRSGPNMPWGAEVAGLW